MNLLLDTNILILLAKDVRRRLFNTIINPTQEKVFVSIASLSELKSIALQNNWGARKWDTLNAILEDAVIMEINEGLADTYAETRLILTIHLLPQEIWERMIFG